MHCMFCRALRVSRVRSTLVAVVMGLPCGMAHAQYHFINIDDPAAGPMGTAVEDISGPNTVGYFFDSNGSVHAFVLNGSHFTTIDDPLASALPGHGTTFIGIDGNNVVGGYDDANNVAHGFLYNIVSKTFTPIDDPLGTDNLTQSRIRDHGGTEVTGISGNIVVGDYVDGNGVAHAFLYNLATSTFTQPIDD